MEIRPFEAADEDDVVALWEECGLVRPWNDPRKDIARKLKVQPELFLVACREGRVVGSAMAGFDGHRGWVYYLAVAPAYRNGAYGRALMERVERLLAESGCPKVNLMVRTANRDVLEFYRKLGYEPDDVTNLGKRLIVDQA